MNLNRREYSNYADNVVVVAAADALFDAQCYSHIIAFVDSFCERQ